MIGGRKALTGRKPGDRRIRVERPYAASFRYAGPDQLVARPSAGAPTTAGGRAVAAVKRIMAELGLDAAVVPPKRPTSGKRHIKARSAARSVRRAGPGAATR